MNRRTIKSLDHVSLDNTDTDPALGHGLESEGGLLY